MAVCPPSPSHYDTVTSDDLFNSFMDIALSAEQEDNNGSVETPMPLLLKSPNPVYETIDKEKTNNLKDNEDNLSENPYSIIPTNKVENHEKTPTAPESPTNSLKYVVVENTGLTDVDNTIITVTATPTITSIIPPPDYLGARTSLDKENVRPDISDLYAKVNKVKNNQSESGVIVTTTRDLSPEYAVVNKHWKSQSLKTEPYKSDNDYETIDNFVSKETIKKVRSLDSKGSNDYESLSNFEHISTKERVLSPEDIAFGLSRFQTQGQADLYKSCFTTIERGALLDGFEKKKHFFHFSRGKSVEKVEEKSPPRNRRFSNIPSLCSGYLFKQGGTGITPKNWRLRWFELKKDHCLYYYKNEQDPTPAGAVMLTNYSVTRAVEANKRFAFKLAKGGARTYYFAANSEEEMKKWMKNLGEAVCVTSCDQSSIPECSLKNVSVSAISIAEPDCHGFLWKQGNFHKTWRRRYCVLKYGCLFYYEDMADQVAIGVFKLNNYTIHENEMRESSRFGFKATAPARKMRSYFFYAESEVDRKRWMEAMRHSLSLRNSQC